LKFSWVHIFLGHPVVFYKFNIWRWSSKLFQRHQDFNKQHFNQALLASKCKKRFKDKPTFQ